MRPHTHFLSLTESATPRRVSAFQRAIDQYLNRSDIAGVDLGFRIRKGMMRRQVAVRIHVRKKKKLQKLDHEERVPTLLGGIRTDVIESDFDQEQGLVEEFRKRSDPIYPGLSIGPIDGGAGTLGSFVTDLHHNRIVLLTSAHVLAPPNALPGHRLLQPAPADGGRASDEIGYLDRLDRATDSAVAVLNDSRGFSNAPPFDIGA